MIYQWRHWHVVMQQMTKQDDSPMRSLVCSDESSQRVSFRSNTQARMRMPHLHVFAWQHVSIATFSLFTVNLSSRICTTPELNTIWNTTQTYTQGQIHTLLLISTPSKQTHEVRYTHHSLRQSKIHSDLCTHLAEQLKHGGCRIRAVA